MNCLLRHVNYKFDLPDETEEIRVVETTSRSTTWSRGLSPFVVGPCDLYGEFGQAKNMENCWQFAKVFPSMTDIDGNPSPAYFEWAKKGWADSWAHRYPMGPYAVPLYSYWDGEKLDYVAARKKIYIPKYAGAVRKTETYQRLEEIYQNCKELFILDFDHHNMQNAVDYWKLADNPKIKFGHGYVLGMLLTGLL